MREGEAGRELLRELVVELRERGGGKRHGMRQGAARKDDHQKRRCGGYSFSSDWVADGAIRAWWLK